VKQDCTPLFVRYREIARLVWNLGFWPYPELHVWACLEQYEEAMMRLFEGMILRPLGFANQILGTGCPGNVVNFWVAAKYPDVELLVDEHAPDEPGRIWGNPVVRLGSESSYKLKFVAFFDWYQLDPRDFRLLKVSIEQLDGKPELVGRHALIELAQCSVWLNVDET